MMVGIPGEATFANYGEARSALWEDTIIPAFDGTLEELNSWLTPRFGTGLKLCADYDQVPALAQRREAVWKRLEAADFLTIDEKREAVGYDKVEGGDVILVPATMLPLGFDIEAELGQAEEMEPEEFEKYLRARGIVNPMLAKSLTRIAYAPNRDELIKRLLPPA
jgi:hypothetical protein